MQANCCTSHPVPFVGFWWYFAYDYLVFLQDGVTTNDGGKIIGHLGKDSEHYGMTEFDEDKNVS